HRGDNGGRSTGAGQWRNPARLAGDARARQRGSWRRGRAALRRDGARVRVSERRVRGTVEVRGVRRAARRRGQCRTGENRPKRAAESRAAVSEQHSARFVAGRVPVGRSISDRVASGGQRSRAGGAIGALGAARRISYRRVTGYDALFGAQDLLTGAQLGVLASPGTMASHTDLLGGATFYAGHAGARWFGGAEVESEARRDFALHDWSSL